MKSDKIAATEAEAAQRAPLLAGVIRVENAVHRSDGTQVTVFVE